MTLATRAHIAKPVDAEALFLHLLGILESDPEFVPAWTKPPDGWGPTEPGPLRLGRASYEHRRKGEPVYQCQTGKHLWDQAESEFRSTLGQGLAAILEVEYASDGPLNWPGVEYEDTEEEDTSGDTVPRMPLHCVSVYLDTAYGYRAPTGAGCADLHAFLLREMGRWLEDAGVEEWIWHHEFTGTWHGPDETERLGNADLAAAHFLAGAR